MCVTPVVYFRPMALIPPFFLNTVVAIGNRGEDDEISWCATGFFFGVPIPSIPGNYFTYLVTNRHVLLPLTRPVIRMNPEGLEPAKVFDISLHDDNGKSLWAFHPDENVDVAVTTMNFQHDELANISRSFFESDHHALTTEGMRVAGISEANHVVVLGFPMGIVGDVRNAVLVRTGSIARLRDLYDGYGNSFLIDATVLPGNSGGPVVQLVEPVFIEGTQNQTKSNLIGIVAEYLTYNDIAISQQTKRARVSFEENSGLAKVFPVETILECIEEWQKSHRDPE
jgi:hypothetical protein